VQVTARQCVGQHRALFDIQQMERCCAFSAVFNFVEQESPIRGDAKRPGRGVRSSALRFRVDEYFVRTVPTFTKTNAGLFFVPQSLFRKKYRVPTCCKLS
jgi:hypothetical protein